VVACSPELDDTVGELRAAADPARVTVVELPDVVAEVLELVADLAVGA
jgi:hypothetical protein